MENKTKKIISELQYIQREIRLILHDIEDCPSREYDGLFEIQVEHLETLYLIVGGRS